jgi:transcriptional regulator with XRE-family HTH domain
MKYNERIRDLREDNDLSQREISEIVNISQRTYSDYETGTVRIPIEILIHLAKYYNVDMNYITGISNTKNPYPKL